MITSQNIFAALDTKKKKKSSKSKDADEKKKKKEVSKADRSAELERAIFSGPKVSISNWADTDDDDDDFVDELPESWSAPVRLARLQLGICTVTVAPRMHLVILDRTNLWASILSRCRLYTSAPIQTSVHNFLIWWCVSIFGRDPC